ncbi:hypothetical protein [Hymenobacter norwichensis]|uniref:hypothetical protein n=1 Tax=Hymenobacter norwichensis TaxID=223903 RepID=UPI0012F935A4|nr:hypothetical protein [Hymenobacter norwichensis]
MAQSKIYFSNRAGKLLENPAGYLEALWSATARQEGDAQALFMHMLHALRRYNWSRILINQVGMLPFSPSEQQWVAQEWLPLAVQAGYRHGAIVVSPNVMVRLATAYVTTHVQGLPLLYRSFETKEEATEWLLRQPMSPQK